ncbi:MAG: N-acetylmuramoyl-L-alanine amidase [Clostridia bacterium]|nr:N-acetylmuramoyl-L-alanine amidase [Clostridia bacterium]
MVNFFVKNRVIIVIVLIFSALTTIFYNIVEVSSSKYNGFTIVVDAGHGGRDGGSVGVNGTIEKEINLEYALALKEKLVNNGYRVILTRKNDDGLYRITDKNKKMSDMKERFRIIKKANPNLVISIHMNSFQDMSARGATTYYRKGDDSGERCAELIQKSFYEYCGAKQQKGKVGDYYMLNCSYYTSVLIECGFLSNPEEEVLLCTTNYKEKIVEAIHRGILLYLGNAEI